MGGFERKASDLVKLWDSFQVREVGFYPPKLAAMALGLTTQGLYSAANRGVFRFQLLGVSRFYSRKDVSAEIASRYGTALDAVATPLDRHLQASVGYQPEIPPPRPVPSVLSEWHRFLEVHGGAYPSQVAAARLRISAQGVLIAHRAGWIRSFLVGRENFFSTRDVQDYWDQAARKNKARRPVPRFKSAAVVGKC